MRIIDANRAKELAEICMGDIFLQTAVNLLLDKTPTVDAVPVVRCKDCENWMYEYDDVGLCVADVPDIDGVQRMACDFCSYGERKEK